jgi:multiple sugar transport system substrate-binding protein
MFARRVVRRQLLHDLGILVTSAGLVSACGAPAPTAKPPEPKAPEAKPAAPVAATAAAPSKPAAAVKPQAAPTTPQPVKLVHWDSNPNPRRTKQYQIAGETFAKNHPNVTVEYVPVPIANYQEKLVASITAGSPPDVGDMWFNWLAQFVGMKALLNLEPQLKNWERFSDYSPGHLKLARSVDNSAYVVAGDIFLQGTHYRKDLVKEAGVDDPKELDKAGKWNWESFGRVAKAIHKPDKNLYGVSMRGGVGADFTIFNMLISATGGKWFDDAGNCRLGSKEAMAALDWYAGLATDLKVCQPSAAADGFQEFTNNFFNGIAGMMIHNDDGINGLNRLGREKYATAQMPASPAGMYMGMVGYGPAVFAATKHPELSAQFAFHFVESWVANTFEADKQMNTPTQVMSVAPMLSDAKNDILKDPLYEAFYDVPNKFPERTFVNPYWLPEYNELTIKVVTADFQKILAGQLKPEQAATRWGEEFTKAQQAYMKRR